METHRALMKQALEWEGAGVVTATHGQQAIQILAARPQDFNAVLMDLQMPVMDGLTATRLIRERLSYPQAIAPLAQFLRSPRRRSKASPVKILPLSDYHRLLRSDMEYRSVQGSRAWKAASTVSAWRRKLTGNAP